MIEIIGTDLPGRRSCGYANVHVGVQRGAEPFTLVAADAPVACDGPSGTDR